MPTGRGSKVPPAQCPECGRFLSKDFVSALTDAGTACPSCETTLRAVDFDGSGPDGDSGPAMASNADTPGEAADPLEGWDQGHVVDPDDWRAGQADGPDDLAVIGVAAAVGALLGLVIGRPSRLLAMLFGAVLGAAGAVTSRRVWELDQPGR